MIVKPPEFNLNACPPKRKVFKIFQSILTVDKLSEMPADMLRKQIRSVCGDTNAWK